MIRKAKKYDILKKAFQTMIIKGQVKTSGCSKTFLIIILLYQKTFEHEWKPQKGLTINSLTLMLLHNSVILMEKPVN